MGTGAALLAGAAGPADGLDGLARRKGLRFGTALGVGRPPNSGLDDAGYRALIARECGLIVAENEHKWYVLRPSADRFDFGPADRLATFARENGLGFRGHTLLWNRDEYSARWLASHDFGPNPRAAAERMLTDHIRTVCGRYPQMSSWDVVNETVDPATGELRNTVMGRAIGPEIVEVAFHAAKAAAPKAKLVYNDYMNFGVEEATHRKGVLKLLERLKARNAPIDALGIQGHIGGGVDSSDVARFSAADQRDWRAFIDEVRGMGLDLLVTEFDVNDKAMPADIAKRDAELAALAGDFTALMLDYRELKQFLVWGLADRYSWLQGTSARRDGLPKRPTPYDAELRAKPMREALAAAFRAAPERTPWA
ncbi:endo-1,4-beta-xylanase [Phenylobacterium sp.]|uniref:endo-1,4-beta-xylanase n=1 Tax=Phenylobacterium sp. TaxID=1871053 RepID=UPI0035B3D871